MLSAYMHVWHAVRRVNGWLFHLSLSWDSHFCKWWVIQIFLSGSSISDWGKRSARMCSDSEKNMSAFADQNHAPSLTYVRLENWYVCVARSASCEWLIISLCKYRKRSILSGKAIKQTTEFHEFLREWERPLFQAWERARWKRRETRVVSV